MNERTKKIITAIVVIVIFVVCIGLIIVGQRNIGPKGLPVSYTHLTLPTIA